MRLVCLISASSFFVSLLDKLLSDTDVIAQCNTIHCVDRSLSSVYIWCQQWLSCTTIPKLSLFKNAIKSHCRIVTKHCNSSPFVILTILKIIFMSLLAILLMHVEYLENLKEVKNCKQNTIKGTYFCLD